MLRSVARFAFALCSVVWTGFVVAEDAAPRPIFDGQTLTGWKPWAGDEQFWRVENGAIVAESTEANPCDHNSFLLWDHGEVDDFELKLKFRITGSDAANSGIQFRGVLRDDGHVVGYQADIDKKGQWVGCLYDEAMPRTLLARRGQKVTIRSNEDRTAEEAGNSDELFSHVKPDDWNEYSIKAIGNVITLAINGHQTVQVIDEDPAGLDRYGKLALQLHSGPPMKIEFKEIQLQRFPMTEGWKKIVFVAGTPSHGYFSHEHNAGCLLLAEKLNAAAKEHGVKAVATVYTNGWPKDPTAMDNVDCVVSYCDGGGRHYLNDRLDDFDHLAMEHGIGLVCIHYAVETTAGTCGDHFLEWMGGFFEPHWSVNPHWTASFDMLPEHPITRGVKPFEINDEWYYHMRFVPGMQGVTPILTDMPPRETLSRPDGPHSGNPHVRAAVLERMEPQHVAWAYERPGNKGRGFGFTGGHFHQNWQNDDFRKTVLNAIVWAANGEVPADGVPSATPTQEEMEANQDEPKPADQQVSDASKRQPALGDKSVKPAFESRVIDASTPGHAVEIDVDIAGARKLFLVVTDGGNGFACDWADWAEPRLVGPAGEYKVSDMDWKTASTQWGDVRKGKNANGGDLRISGQPVAYGIGTHANSVIEFDLPKDHTYTRFKARGGLDNGGTDQGGGTSVQFLVFTQRPGKDVFSRLVAAGSSEPASHESTDAIEQLDVHPALQATLFASEPMMTNPASIDVDHLGRVWVCEAINYRAFRNQDIIGDLAKEGDRILILEDTNGDAVADKSTVFYQGHDVDSAHGIMVLPSVTGNSLRAIVSALDSVFFLIDDNGDLKADRKELLFTGIDGAQHDHGIHAFHFGPDGKLYFNFGNAGKHIKDKEGKPIVDKAGNEVNDSRKPYQEGMVFRCNLDGSEFETLGWNFRNNWEACVDSFGTIWQSDNDDDGNRGVRINYVMEYGNYGYKDELTGAGWKDPRTNMETEIPHQHWHLNDPGVVPNLLQTGAGAPTGICLYEGNLLPKQFRGAVIHCDAGPNICRAYVPTPAGAGYTAEIVNILDGARNKWFRPSDVCVAPDGSLLVADWYDPGVGGHRMQDAARGRIFRVAPKGDAAAKYAAPRVDVSTAAGAVAALQSPNMTARYLGWTALHAMGPQTVPALEQLWKSTDPVMQARALGVLLKLPLSEEIKLKYLAAAVASPNADIRCAAVRLARQLRSEIDIQKLIPLTNLRDPSPAVRRELLIGLREELKRGALTPEQLTEPWVPLAQQYDGQDRWYLEALGIAADGHWDVLLSAYLATEPKSSDKAVRDIIWRSRAAQTPDLLATLISTPQTPAEELPRYLRALDFLTGSDKEAAVAQLAFADLGDAGRSAIVNAEALNRLASFGIGLDIGSKPEHKATLNRVLDANRGTPQFVRLVDKFSVADRYGEVLALVQSQPQSQVAIEGIKTLFDKQQQPALRAALTADDLAQSEATMLALATAADGRAVKLLSEIMRNTEQPLPRRRAALKSLGAIRPGALELQELAEQGGYDDSLRETLAATLHTVQWKDIKEFAAKKFPLPPGKDSEPIPPIAELATRAGDVTHGSVLFHSTATCATCHQVGMLGKNVGPNLSEIGKKLSKEALWESILYPSAAISHNFENWLVVDRDGNQFTGLLVSETDAAVELKDAKGLVRSIPKASIEIQKKQDISLMPADVQKTLSVKELVDVVEYLTTLKEATK